MGIGEAHIGSRPKDAVECASKNKFDFIFMDVNLDGGSDGISAAREIRKYQLTRINFVKSYAGDNAQLTRAVRDLDRSDVVTKPVASSKLKKTIVKFHEN